LLKDYNSQK